MLRFKENDYLTEIDSGNVGSDRDLANDALQAAEHLMRRRW